MMRKAGSTLVLLAALQAAAQAQTVVLDDSLRGSTSGTQGGGAFGADGWRVTHKNDFIYWHVPTLTAGAVEFSVRGIPSNDARPEGYDKNEFFHMYDYTYNNADTNYDGYRNGPYKHFIRKTNVGDAARTDSMELVWLINTDYVEPDTARLSWDPGTTYRFREEWGPDGSGRTFLRTYRDGTEIMNTSVLGSWTPGGQSIRIAASTRAPLYGDFGAPVDAVFSDVKVWSLAGGAPPPPGPGPAPAPAPPGPPRTSDHKEGFVNDKCTCGSTEAPRGIAPGLLLCASLVFLILQLFVSQNRTERH